MITALGMALGKRRDRPINIKIGEKPLTLQVENAGEESGALLWKLVDITKAAATVVDTSSPTEEAEIDRLARQDEGIASPPAPDAQNDDYEPF